MTVQQVPLTGSQLAREVGLSSARIRQMAIAGELPFTNTPLGRLFDRECVEIIEDARREAGRARRQK